MWWRIGKSLIWWPMKFLEMKKIENWLSRRICFLISFF
jgi:hypothetical protein